MTTATYNQKGKKVKVYVPSKIEEMEDAPAFLDWNLQGESLWQNDL